MLSLNLRLAIIGIIGNVLAAVGVFAQGQPASGLLISRAELAVAAEHAELAATQGDLREREKNAMLAAAIRQRLRDGDFQVGDRVVVTIVAAATQRDTLVVRTGRAIEVPGNITVPLTGVLRSELQERVTTEVLKYVKAQQVEATSLMRVGVLGEVAHPGYFAFASDIPLTDAIMGAGGPTATAEIGRSVVRRGTTVLRSSDETRNAIARGLTLDQFGLRAGDELVIGRRRETFQNGPMVALIGVLASVVTIIVALQR